MNLLIAGSNYCQTFFFFAVLFSVEFPNCPVITINAQISAQSAYLIFWVKRGALIRRITCPLVPRWRIGPHKRAKRALK